MGGRATKAKKQGGLQQKTRSQPEVEIQSLSIAVVTEFEGRNLAEEGVPSHVLQRAESYVIAPDSSALLALPKELQAMVLSLLDLPSLVHVARTCSLLYAVVASHPALWRRILETLCPAVHDQLPGISVEDLQRSAAVALLRRSPSELGRRVPHRLTEAVSKAFDPEVNRIKCFATVRSFPIPEVVHRLVKPGELGKVVEDTYATMSFGKQQAELDENLEMDKEASWLDDDAWTAFYGADMPSIFSFRLEALPDDQAYNEQILQKIATINTTGNSMHVDERKCKLPSVKHSLQVIARLVGEDRQVILWKDASFCSKGLAGHRLVVLGRRRACVLQMDYYSNYCGGPFANYDCGMG
jgi:hypothetical protein